MINMQAQKTKNTVRNLAIAATITGALALAGCGQPQYRFDGKLGNEHVKYYDSDLAGLNHNLEVERKDGTKIKYECRNIFGGNGVSFVTITKDGVSIKYEDDKVGAEVIKEGQKQYVQYLADILAAKQNKGLEDLKR